MAMEHTVAWVAGNELLIARLRYSYEYCISRTPRGFRLSSAFRSGDDKSVAMKMDGVVVHSGFALSTSEWTTTPSIFMATLLSSPERKADDKRVAMKMDGGVVHSDGGK